MMIASRHDFIILNKKLEKYFKILEDNFGLSLNIGNDEKKRLGFYIYIIEHVCNESDIENIVDSIIDTEFNKIVFSEVMNDHGADAVYINEERMELKIFNFKYRKNFSPDQTQSLNDAFTTTKFLNFALKGNNESFSKNHDKVKEKLKKVHQILNHTQEEWSVEVIQVSNEAKKVKEDNNELEYLSKTYSINMRQIALPDIAEYMSIRPEEINASIVVGSEALMSYSESDKASAKSFIVRMPCSEVLRITCNSEELRQKTNIEDSSLLSKVELDFGVLFDNVRGLVKKSKYNSGIEKTLKNNPKKFFMYNNGVTLISKSIESTPLAGNKRVRLKISDFQVVNGGQTLRTIHEFNNKSEDNLEKYLYDAEVLVRIFMPGGEDDEAHKIAEYTNSQNPVKSVDLKSLSKEQIEIERFLDEHNIGYARKSGDTGPNSDKNYKYIIKMEEFGKILKARSGSPEKATNGLKEIFEGGYEKLFLTNFDINSTPELINKYFRIIRLYKENKIRGNQLKYYYVVFFSEGRDLSSEQKIIDLLEEQLNHYLSENQTTAVKALGSYSFRKIFEEAVANNIH